MFHSVSEKVKGCFLKHHRQGLHTEHMDLHKPLNERSLFGNPLTDSMKAS